MFPRSGMSIRRLISQRKERGDEEEPEVFPPLPPLSTFDHDELLALKASMKQQKGRSWLPSKQTKKVPKPIIIIRQTEDIERIRLGLPPLSDTPRSSSSSLCSCEFNEFDLTRPRPSPRRPGSRGSTRSPPRSPALCPPTPPTKDGFTTRPRSSMGVPRENKRPRSSSQPIRHNPRAHMITPPSSAKSSLDFEKPPVHTPEQKSTTQLRVYPNEFPPTPPDTAKETLAPELDHENFDEFSREADKAFRITSPLSEVSKVVLLPRTFSPPPTVPKETQQAPSLSRSKSRKGSISSTKSAPKTPKSPTRTPSRTTSINKSRRKPKKFGRRPRPIVHKSHTSRWTLSENAKDLFTVRIFHRIEADEMLPESKLEEIRGNIKSQASLVQTRQSTDTLRTSESDNTPCETPIEPFHLEGLPSRIGAAGVGLNVPSPIAEVPTPRSFEFSDAVKADPTPEDPFADKESTLPEATAAEGKKPMTYKKHAFPAPPAKNPARFSQHRRPGPPIGKQLPPLPPIPEVFVTSPENVILSPTSKVTPRMSDDYIYLPGTDYTLICPTHKQGPIRLTRSEIPMEALTAAIDDTLDWTAFQMAILGGAGDLYGETTDYSRLSDEDLNQMDELVDWFEGFGFDSPGNLIGVEEAEIAAAMSTPSSLPSLISTTSRTSTISANSSPRSVGFSSSPQVPQQEVVAPHEVGLAISDLPIPVELEHPSGFWNAGVQNSHADQFFASQNVGVKRWGGEGHPKRPSYIEKGCFLSIDAAKSNSLMASQFRRGSASGSNRSPRVNDLRRPSVDSIQSLPQSPMLELVVSKDVEGNEYVVPMGFNLGHDLGDYLQWENECVFWGGYLPEE